MQVRNARFRSTWDCVIQKLPLILVAAGFKTILKFVSITGFGRTDSLLIVELCCMIRSLVLLSSTCLHAGKGFSFL